MSQKVESVHLGEVIDRAAGAVEATRRDGGLIEATVVAQRLLDEYPECPMTLTDLTDKIARLAAAHGVSVEFADQQSGSN